MTKEPEMLLSAGMAGQYEEWLLNKMAWQCLNNNNKRQPGELIFSSIIKRGRRAVQLLYLVKHD